MRILSYIFETSKVIKQYCLEEANGIRNCLTISKSSWHVCTWKDWNVSSPPSHPQED